VRRLIVLAALALAAAPGDARALRLAEPRDPVFAHPHAASLGAELVLRGRAPRHATVTARVRCEIGTCGVATEADGRGRFAAPLDLVLPRAARTLRIRLTAGDARWARTYGLVLPDYAYASPYADDARVPELVVIGDSLAVGTDPLLREALPGWRVTAHAREGRALAAGMSVLGMTPLPRRPRALAFSLFTNDDPRGVAGLEAAVRTSLTRLGSRDCALWATIVRPKVGGVGYGAANGRLRALAAEDERLRVVDWARAVRRHPEWMRPDRVHPDAEGYAARARMYARAAARCAAEGGWE
jgi:hypothetical protein